MARIFITGSTEGLGRAAAVDLLDDGHEVVLHARNPSRAASMGDLADRASGVVIGDLASAEETHDVADQVNAIGRMDAVIHNAAIYIDPQRVATLAFSVSRRWPDVRSNVVDPGWVPTRMGGQTAPDDLELGHTTQVWLAVSDEPDATGTGAYWYHRRHQAPAPAVSDVGFHDALLDELSRFTGVRLP